MAADAVETMSRRRSAGRDDGGRPAGLERDLREGACAPRFGAPASGIFHCAGPSPIGGWRVIEVSTNWDQETFPARRHQLHIDINRLSRLPSVHASDASGYSSVRKDAGRTIEAVMLAGLPIPNELVLDLAGRLRDSGLDNTAERLEGACADSERRVVALTIPDRESILRVLEDAPEGLGELRAVLLKEHEWRKSGGL